MGKTQSVADNGRPGSRISCHPLRHGHLLTHAVSCGTPCHQLFLLWAALSNQHAQGPALCRALNPTGLRPALQLLRGATHHGEGAATHLSHSRLGASLAHFRSTGKSCSRPSQVHIRLPVSISVRPVSLPPTWDPSGSPASGSRSPPSASQEASRFCSRCTVTIIYTVARGCPQVLLVSFPLPRTL